MTAILPTVASADSPRAFGDVRVFADIPQPGHPEGIAVLDGVAHVSFPNSAVGIVAPSLRPSQVIGFDLVSASTVSSVAIEGERLLHANGLLGMAPGTNHSIYLLTREDVIGPGRVSARVLRLDFSVDPPIQTTYALIPDVPSCSAGQGDECSETRLDLRPVPNEIEFDLDGSAYVTDSAQGTIWRIPPGGGTADLWFTDPRIDAVVTGPNGIALDLAARRLYLATSPSPIDGAIWRLPLVASPGAADLERFHTFMASPVSVPDGLALGEKGLYVALASDQAVVLLDLDGNEIERIVLKSRLQLNKYGITQPAALAFDGTGRLLVTNGDFNNPLGLGSAVFDVWVDDPGVPLFLP